METGIRTDRDSVSTADRALLSRELINERIDERRDISRFLHDGISQHLVALSFTVSALPAALTGLPDTNDENYIPSLIERCCRDIRAISCMLTPPPHLSGSLAATIESYAGWLREEAGLVVHVNCDLRVEEVAPDTESLLLAAVQQWTIRTLLKRVKASLFITLGNDDFGILLQLKSVPDRVVKDANGLEVMTDGWAAIRERATAIGGRLEITANAAGALALMSLPEKGSV
jgi:signal transduction histidine kinase